MTENEYNGWTNYETWAVNLWIGNEQSSQEFWNERAQECANDAQPTEVLTREESARYTLSDALKEHFDDENPLADQASVWADLMNAALSEVNWSEIAAGLLESVARETAAEEA